MQNLSSVSRRTLVAGGVASFAAALSACGHGEDRRTAQVAAGPITLEHQYGTTSLSSRPSRVVTMAGNWTDALIALGVPITAEYVTRGYSGRDNRFAWTPPHDSQLVEMTNTAEIELERLAAFGPELILAGYVGDKKAYERLAKVAPTVPVMDKAAVLDTWQAVTTTAGRIFGRDTEARQLVTKVGDEVAGLPSEFTAAKGKTFSFGQLTADGQFGLVADESDPAAKLIGSSGLALSSRLKSVANGGNRVLVSQERTDLIATDLLVMWPLTGGPESLAEVPGWKSLPAVRQGSVVFLDNDNAAAFGSPTIYSVPYALDLLRPALGKLR